MLLNYNVTLRNIYMMNTNHKPYRKFFLPMFGCREGTVASWFARSSLDRAVQVRVLAGNIVLCSWASHFTLTVPLSTQVYKWVLANLMRGGGNPAMD